MTRHNLFRLRLFPADGSLLVRVRSPADESDINILRERSTHARAHDVHS